MPFLAFSLKEQRQIKALISEGAEEQHYRPSYALIWRESPFTAGFKGRIFTLETGFLL